jgi:hypothetical protein
MLLSSSLFGAQIENKNNERPPSFRKEVIHHPSSIINHTLHARQLATGTYHPSDLTPPTPSKIEVTLDWITLIHSHFEVPKD